MPMSPSSKIGGMFFKDGSGSGSNEEMIINEVENENDDSNYANLIEI